MVGSEREGPSDPRKRESMHRIARWAGAAALGLTYATSWQARLVAEGVDKIAPPYTWQDLLDISNALELGWEYGQELVGAAHADREGAWAAFRLFGEPSGSYRKSPFLRTTLEYSQTEGKFSVGLGDSYMLGEYDNTSPLTLYKDLMIERRGVSGWVDYIVAQRGKTTEEIIRDQVLSPKVKGELDKWDVFDAWSSVGANDFIEVATTIDAIQELKLVGQDPLEHPEVLFKYSRQMLDMLSVTRYRFSKFLNALYDEYGQKIRHIVIILLPDLGRAAAIASQKFGLEPERIAIVDPRAKRIVSEIAEKVNGAWLEEAQEFHERTGIKIVAIDTFKDSLFRKDDQHLNRAGREAIAEEAYDRTVFSAT